tara:strand:+ start:383 stop:652 length:270 start_codon:yes stop_codon:yes gene_type:complete
MSDMVSIEKNGIKIIIPTNYESTARDCLICGFALRDMQDVHEHINHGCCTDCSLYFRQPNRKKWEAGWRPERKQVEKVIFISKPGEKNA